MKNIQFDKALYLDKKKAYTIIAVGGVLFVLSLLGILIAQIFWDDYTYLAYSLKQGREVTAGWPTTLQGWSIGFAICIPIVYGIMALLMWDFKNPVLAVNDQGIFINMIMFKKCFIRWDEIKSVDRIRENNKDALQLTFHNPKAVVDKNPGFFKAFLKEYAEGNPVTLNNTPSKGNYHELIDYAVNAYHNLEVITEEEYNNQYSH